MKLIQNRPVFLNLLRIRQPVTAVLSILHRITGVLMVLLLPVLIYFLHISLNSAEGFAHATDLLDSKMARGIGVLGSWVLAHHLLAGIRFLILDFDVGVTRNVARKTAWLVNGSAVLVALVVARMLF